MISLLQNKQYIFLGIAVLLSFIILVSVLLFSGRQAENPIQLTPREQQIPVAQSQPFLNELPEASPGSLLIFSNPTGARVVIDGPEGEGGADLPIDLPVHFTPVRIDSIPAGGHHIFISKEGFQFKELDVEVTPGEITRITVDLEEEALPQPSVINWQNALPITQERYTVSYSPTTGIIVSMRIQSANPQEAQDEAQTLSDQIKNELERIGVPLSSEKITWRIE
jgi:hypothetical protein